MAAAQGEHRWVGSAVSLLKGQGGVGGKGGGEEGRRKGGGQQSIYGHVLSLDGDVNVRLRQWKSLEDFG